jgi:hypothetical protein
MSEAHNFTFGGLGCDFEAVGETRALDQQGMVASGGKRRREMLKNIRPAMLDRGQFAMHLPRSPDDLAAELLTDGLVAQANAQDGFLACKGLYDVETYTGISGGAGAGRDEYTVGI